MDKEQVYFDNYAENWDRDRKADREKIERLSAPVAFPSFVQFEPLS